MASNIEVKARAREPDRQLRRAAELAGAEAAILEQVDTFFHLRKGRLKLREQVPGHAELIFYQRADQAEPKHCYYSRLRIAEPGPCKQLLADALGVRGVVRKRRRLFLVGQTRIHVDEVEGLGMFLELEVVLRPRQSAARGEKIARALIQELGIAESDLVSCAYIDLLTNRES